jgi:opacity protein-like surface antigen
VCRVVVGLALGCSSLAAYGAEGATAKHSDIGEKKATSFGPSVGLVNVEKDDSANMSLGAFYNYTIQENLMAGATMDYWRSEYQENDRTDIDVSDWTIGANVKLVMPAKISERINLQPYIGAGPAWHRIKAEDASDDSEGAVSETAISEQQFGVDLMAGLYYYVYEQIDLMGQVSYRNIVEDNVDFDQVAFNAGITYKL